MTISATTVGTRALAATVRERVGETVSLAGADGSSFSDTLGRALEGVSELQDRSNDAIRAYLRGDPVEPHQVMAAAEEAGIALDALIQIRNKLTEAYRSVMQMQS